MTKTIFTPMKSESTDLNQSTGPLYTNKLEQAIRLATQKSGIALMGHVVCGYPSFEANWEILEALNQAGASVVELQFPFTEPIADGTLFLEANQQSLLSGTQVDQCFDLMYRASQAFPFKIVMMGYYNTVFKRGEEKFADLVVQNGGSGLILPDLPLIEEGENLLQLCMQRDLSLISLVAPTNSHARIKRISEIAQGFMYAVARLGVTGKDTEFGPQIDSYLALLRENSPVPVGVGFGIARPEHIQYLRGRVDMAVLGSAVLRAYQAGGKKSVADFLSRLMES